MWFGFEQLDQSRGGDNASFERLLDSHGAIDKRWIIPRRKLPKTDYGLA